MFENVAPYLTIVLGGMLGLISILLAFNDVPQRWRSPAVAFVVVLFGLLVVTSVIKEQSGARAIAHLQDRADALAITLDGLDKQAVAASGRLGQLHDATDGIASSIQRELTITAQINEASQSTLSAYRQYNDLLLSQIKSLQGNVSRQMASVQNQNKQIVENMAAANAAQAKLAEDQQREQERSACETQRTLESLSAGYIGAVHRKPC